MDQLQKAHNYVLRTLMGRVGYYGDIEGEISMRGLREFFRYSGKSYTIEKDFDEDAVEYVGHGVTLSRSVMRKMWGMTLYEEDDQLGNSFEIILHCFTGEVQVQEICVVTGSRATVDYERGR